MTERVANDDKHENCEGLNKAVTLEKGKSNETWLSLIEVWVIHVTVLLYYDS